MRNRIPWLCLFKVVCVFCVWFLFFVVVIRHGSVGFLFAGQQVELVKFPDSGCVGNQR